MPTPLGALLDEIRNLYVSQLVAAVTEAQGKGEASLIFEPALMNAAGEIVTEGLLDVGMRVDGAVISKEGPREVRVDSRTMMSFSPLRLEWEADMTLELHPFGWDYCEINVKPALDSRGCRTIADWFRTWFERDEPTNDILGVAHFISDPEQIDDYQRFYVDFGTAPVEAFEQLLDTVHAAGAREVVVGRAASQANGQRRAT